MREEFTLHENDDFKVIYVPGLDEIEIVDKKPRSSLPGFVKSGFVMSGSEFVAMCGELAKHRQSEERDR